MYVKKQAIYLKLISLAFHANYPLNLTAYILCPSKVITYLKLLKDIVSLFIGSSWRHLATSFRTLYIALQFDWPSLPGTNSPLACWKKGRENIINCSQPITTWGFPVQIEKPDQRLFSSPTFTTLPSSTLIIAVPTWLGIRSNWTSLSDIMIIWMCEIAGWLLYQCPNV